MNKISAFMDGETSWNEAEQTLLRLRRDEEYRDTWSTFHLIGDAMRGETKSHDDFITRFHLRMEQEPTLLAPRQMWRKSANLGLSIAASLAAVAVVGMLAITENPLNPQAQFAVGPKLDATQISQFDVKPRPTPAANQGKINEYLMAHQEFSPSTALQGVAPYVRTVSAAHDGSGR